MKIPLVFSFAFLCVITSHAQDSGRISNKPFSKGSSSIQLHAGSAGAGLDFRTSFASRFSARAGITMIPAITINSTGGKYDDEISGSSRNVHILVDYTPFKHSAKNFRIVAGAAYIDTKGTVNRSTKDGEFSYGDIPVSKEEVGVVTAKTVYKGIAPYGGIGAFNIFGAKKININFDFGAYYLPAPQTSLTGTGMLSGMDSENEQLEENLKGYRWLPLIQLNLIYKF